MVSSERDIVRVEGLEFRVSHQVGLQKPLHWDL